MSIVTKFIPLTFINTDDEILKQIKNSVVFSYLFDEFEETSLDHYLESTQYGYTASASDTGQHRLLRITDINNGAVNWATVPFCNCETEEKYLLKDNDILIARTGGTTGKSFIVSNAPDNAVFASYLIRLRLKKGINLDFISRFLNSYTFWSQIIEMKSGSAMPNVNAEKLKTLKLPKCDESMQDKLAQYFLQPDYTKEFDNLNNRMKLAENTFMKSKSLTDELCWQRDCIQQLRQAFLREAMQGNLVKQNKNEGHAKDLLQQIKAEKARAGKKEKELPTIKPEEIPFNIPDNWVWCRLGELCNYGSSPKAEPKDLTEKTWVLDLEDIEKETSKLLCKVRFAERNSLSTKSRFKKGDVLYSKLRPYLDKVIVADEDGVCTTEILPLSFTKHINPFFLRYTLKRGDFLNYVNSVTRGMKMPRLGTKEGQLALIPLPPLAEQTRIVTKMDFLVELCDQLQESVQQSKERNETLLQQVLREVLQPKEQDVEV